ncbi:aerotaxis receptor Aer [Actinotalea ferrariae CF5-4]|uniref:Aerotaxis receptor Aer n=1 Tax=Actinotalea ferrariae CF5-4 TaxID=948458 RepID=A0A021VL66_9CELL|nr:PAS domain-containing protein [Actinotalea ferrariae]EYR61901.1 aerotaxis receptor Aer [Actinotalea ferrariae CF5-4]
MEVPHPRAGRAADRSAGTTTRTLPPGRTVLPSGVERRLGPEELIVTKTDLQGRLTYANDVFLRMSALEESATLGMPHNIIRHPDMPRAVFHRLWATLHEGREIFAYVKNLATDGAHYRVLAHVTPSTDAAGRPCGYHSNRRPPTWSGIPAVEALYTQLLAVERGLPAREAALAGAAALDDLLAQRGLTYEAWVWSLEQEEAA